MLRNFLFLLAATFPLQALATERLPADVRAFITGREGCDHMRAEIPDPSDTQRMKEVTREIEKLCIGTDRRLAALKQKYASNRAVLRRLARFETSIESSPGAAER